jgi:hypothetical protein
MPHSSPNAPRELTRAERDWIRRQGMTARAVAAEQKRIRDRLAAAAAERMRTGRFSRTGG